MRHERFPKTGNAVLKKADWKLPLFKATGAQSLAIRAGATIAGRRFKADTPIDLPKQLEPGGDYTIFLGDTVPAVADAADVPAKDIIIGGFHFAPGGNAMARSGGDDTPAINPYSIWDLHFRPACPDPRGMTRVVLPHGGSFWCDIYLTGADHLERGTSSFGATIADGDDRPQKPPAPTSGRVSGAGTNGEFGGRYDRFDYAAAQAVMQHHGKALLSVEEFFAAAYGVTEKSAASGNPKTVKLDAPRTSKWGLVQATGNMWIWGHDGDPDNPRASLFGGSWLNGENAGSRYAYLDLWPDDSNVNLGARGRSDHLQLA